MKSILILVSHQIGKRNYVSTFSVIEVIVIISSFPRKIIQLTLKIFEIKTITLFEIRVNFI